MPNCAAEGFWYIARTIAWYRSTGSLTPMQIFLRPWTRQSGWPRTLAASPGGIFLVGDSAGAYLIAYLTAMQRCPAMAAAAGVQAPKAEIRALGLISGMFYTTRRDKVGLTMPRYLYGPDWRKGAFAPYLDPGQWTCLGDFPPSLLVTSRNDMLHQYTVDFAGALERSGAAYRLVDYPADKRLVHAFSAVDPDLPESQEVLSALADFFRQAQ